jgi:alpha-tubulin suppressor-like RCC1 family protein
LWSWGRNLYGALGLGLTTSARLSSPVQIGSETNWSKISAANGYLFETRHNLAIKDNGTLWAWGANEYGQLGNGLTADTSVVVQVGTGITGNWLSADCGELMCAGIRAEGATGRTIWTWGNSRYGRLGRDHGFNFAIRNPVLLGTNSDRDWEMVSCGGQHMVALKVRGTERTLWAWGRNTWGQLGLGDTRNRSSPVQIGTDTDWAKIECGFLHTFASKTDGTMWGWGRSSSNRLGMPDSILLGVSSPVQIGTSLNWKNPTSISDRNLASASSGSTLLIRY